MGELDPIGRARRETHGDGAELWHFAEGDAGVARRLVAFGDHGVGGFGAGASDLVLVRRLPTTTLQSMPRGERLDGISALAKVRDLARALAHCEAKGVFPGPMRPPEIALGSEGRTEAWVLAEGWVRALVGAAHAGSASSSGPSARWTPPEQAGGAPWDNAANRWVLGLVAYRLIAGAHPFSGAGLRDALSAERIPPFTDEVAQALRPGIQSFVLGMLDPDATKRPRSASAIVERCEELIRGDAPRETRPTPAAPDVEARRERVLAAAVGAPSLATPARSASRSRWIGLLPIALGLAIAGASVAASRTRAEPPPAPSAHKALTAAPLQKTTAQACGGCHAREVGEWEGSVMAHAAKSPLFGALESAVEEQVGREDRCPGGAGVLRKAGGDVCRDERTGLSLTGTGGEHWCVNCHTASNNLKDAVPAWNANGRSSQKPLRDILPAQAMEGISCAVCHQTIGPVHGTTAYNGNPTWTSPFTGQTFLMRPEDGLGVRGISNSGYLLDSSMFLSSSLGRGGPGDPIVHKRVPDDTARYVRSSEFCGACHDVRLFGTDSIGVRDRGEHFKRLRNAYSEWKSWSDAEKSAGRAAATCQDCHMSLFPGVCVQSPNAPAANGCPAGTKFEARAPGERARGLVASSSTELKPIASHWFSSVDLPLTPEYSDAWANDRTLDATGTPVGLEARRDQLLAHTFKFTVLKGNRFGGRLEIPIELVNTGAGHRVPAGFSQEREIWVDMTVKDGRGEVLYEVGKITSDDQDLQDKIFTRINTRDDQIDIKDSFGRFAQRDAKGRPQGVFGADVVDGRDVPQWEPNPAFGGTSFRGKGLLNLQNGFLRCVRCIGFIDREGRCQAGPGQGRTRSDRFEDGQYDLDTGECRSNLGGNNAFFETYFPVGALDADRGVVKAPDAILDQRSAAPGVPIRYTYELDTNGRPGPFTVTARLRFRPFPPFLLRAFADYESRKAAQGLRPSGAQVTPAMFRRNHPIDLAEATATIP
ncbi:MAG: hypothetical protein U0270_09890 [Labilithrix sp.]